MRRLLGRTRGGGRRADSTGGPADGRDDDSLAPSVEVNVELVHPMCSQCGRTRFPLAPGWDPPICIDCDAAINEDAIQGGEPTG